MSASLPSEELPRRIARAVADELRGRREMDGDDELPMPLTGLVNIPISTLDNFWPETPATASGMTDDKPNRYK